MSRRRQPNQGRLFCAFGLTRPVRRPHSLTIEKCRFFGRGLTVGACSGMSQRGRLRRRDDVEHPCLQDAGTGTTLHCPRGANPGWGKCAVRTSFSQPVRAPFLLLSACWVLGIQSAICATGQDRAAHRLAPHRLRWQSLPNYPPSGAPHPTLSTRRIQSVILSSTLLNRTIITSIITAALVRLTQPAFDDPFISHKPSLS